MAFRFFRRVTLLPGLRLNLSKRGVSLSAGMPGASVTLGRHGLFGNLGLPGTGLSYRKRLRPDGGGSASQPAVTGHNAAPSQEPRTVKLLIRVQNDGELRFLDQYEQPLPDARMRRLRRRHRKALRDALAEQCAAFNADLHRLDRLHHATPAPTRQRPDAPQAFAQPRPQPEKLLPIPWWTWLWPPLRWQREAENEAAQARFERQMQQWQQARAAHDRRELACRQRARALAQGDVEAMAAEITDALAQVDWPCETSVDFELGDDATRIALDIDFPEEEQLPDREWRLPARQWRLIPEPLGPVVRRRMYRDHVHAIAFRVTGEIFARLPTVQSATVSGYTQAAAPATGAEIDKYLFSLQVARDAWEAIDFSRLEHVDPVAALERFRLRRNMTTTGIFQPIEPFPA